MERDPAQIRLKRKKKEVVETVSFIHLAFHQTRQRAQVCRNWSVEEIHLQLYGVANTASVLILKFEQVMVVATELVSQFNPTIEIGVEAIDDSVLLRVLLPEKVATSYVLGKADIRFLNLGSDTVVGNREVVSIETAYIGCDVVIEVVGDGCDGGCQ